jgi:hypothetical protein
VALGQLVVATLHIAVKRMWLCRRAVGTHNNRALIVQQPAIRVVLRESWIVVLKNVKAAITLRVTCPPLDG